MDVDGSGTINEPEFRKALVLLGHGDVPAEEIHDVFASLDTDGSGSVEYRELYLALGKQGLGGPLTGGFSKLPHNSFKTAW